MKLSIKWLGEFLDLTGLDCETIVNKMVNAGFEVEEVTHLSAASGLTVGEITECQDLVGSTHLKKTKVNTGKEVLDIVCGAPNCRQGLKVIVAQAGAKLPGGTIKEAVIHGERSAGMLCSLLELGVNKELLPDDSPSLHGIEELGAEIKLGDEEVLAHLGYQDEILDVSIYANRPDCLSMFGMAKEMGAILKRKVKLPDYLGKSDCGRKSDFKVHSKSVNCPYFLAKVINEVTIAESPKWLKEHLRANGVKCINNLVDISNYVMLETGQPLHFYDLRSNPEKEITVIDDYEGEYQALDENTYQLHKGDLVITNGGKPSGIAGIMGGENTKILPDTKGIIIECALFDQAQIRRTANRLGLQTEAAMRFAKGLDPLAQKKAMDRAVDLLVRYADAKDIEETVVAGVNHYKPYTVSETLSHLNALIGKKYDKEEVLDVFKRLDFAPQFTGETFTVQVPSYRAADIRIAEDLDEEVVRLTGFTDLAATLPKMAMTSGKLSKRQALRRLIREYLTQKGLDEAVTYTLTDEKGLACSTLALGKPIELLAPLSDARKYLRVGLLNSLLETLSYNLAHYNENVNIFELSSLYAQAKSEERLAILLEGDLQNSKVMHQKISADFYVLKGLLSDLLGRIGYYKGRIEVVPNEIDREHFHPYASAVLKFDREVIGIFGMIHPKLAQARKLEKAYYAELNLEPLLKANPVKIKAGIKNKYPAIARDLALVVKEDTAVADLLKATKKAGGVLVKSVEVFDIYRGEPIAQGSKSVALEVIYEDPTRTLKLEDILPLQAKILAELKKNFAADLRN